MSPRAACRLEALGFEDVYDYLPAKVDWKAHGLPTEGEKTDQKVIGSETRTDVATCRLEERIGDVRPRIEASPYGFGLVVTEHDVLLGRLRRAAWEGYPEARVEDVMEPGPSTLRPDMSVDWVFQRLSKRDLKTAVVTDPEGRLRGVVRRTDLESVREGQE